MDVLSDEDYATFASALGRCASACAEVERGYFIAVANAGDAPLRRMFRHLAAERGEFLEHLRQLGAPFDPRAWAAATARSAAVYVRLALGGDTERLLLLDCDARERRAEEIYERVRRELEGAGAYPDIRSLSDALASECVAIARARTNLDRAVARLPAMRRRQRRNGATSRA